MLTFYQPGNGKAVGIIDDPKYFWWESGLLWDALVDYAFYTGDGQFNGLVGDALQAQVGPNNEYMPPNQTKTEVRLPWTVGRVLTARATMTRPSGAWPRSRPPRKAFPRPRQASQRGLISP